ncbi:uncharacterized protein LOC134281768 [Saccostrea cucullata]|uniref:uncharacterized protein LOC134281768 n=1 Tax=Saccostrea cuccullata TaxID=36930 RepID=UPI002ED1D402
MTQTRARSAANMDNTLEEITGKLFTLDDKIEKLTDIVEKLERHIQCCDDKLNFLINDCAENFHNMDLSKKKENINYKSNVDFILQSRYDNNIISTMYREKRQMIQTWRKNLNERRQAYWNAIRCENLADTYEKWRKQEDVILPRKFRIKSINQEPDEETKIRLNLAIQKFDAEITLLRIRVPKYQTKFEECDSRMEKEISEKTNADMKAKLLDLWKTEVKYEMDKSAMILKRKQEWLNNYEKNYGKEVMKNSPPKQKNHRNKTNGNKNSGYRRENQSSYADAVRNNEPQGFNFRAQKNNFSNENRPVNLHNKNNQMSKKNSANMARNKNNQRMTQPNNFGIGDRNWNKPPKRNQGWLKKQNSLHNSNSKQVNQTRNNSENNFLWKGRFHKGRQKPFRFLQI